METSQLFNLVMDLSVKIMEVQAGLEHIKEKDSGGKLEASIRECEEDVKQMRKKFIGFGQQVKEYLEKAADTRSKFKARVFSEFEGLGQRIESVREDVSSLKAQRDSVELGIRWFIKAGAAAVFLGGLIMSYAWYTIEVNRESLAAQNIRVTQCETLLSHLNKQGTVS